MNLTDVINKMSLRNKIEQLSQFRLTRDDFEEMKDKLKNECIGSFILADSATAGNAELKPLTREQINEIQKVAMENHGIPLLFGHDVIHGHKICMPIPLALSASFNPELVENSYKYIAEECRNDGINWSFAPMLDLCRDPRWGRIIECPGEDPYLGEKMAEAVVKGFQGDDDKINIAACAKHFVGYGTAEGGRDYHRGEISEYTLRNYYLRAFDSAVKNGVATVMNSFNEINGIPNVCNKHLLTDVLRGEMGFDGFVISDWAAIEQLTNNGIAEDKQKAAELCLDAGIDMDMVDCCYYDNLEKSVEEGKISIKTIDEAVMRILSVKEKMGLFENPYFETVEYSKEKHRQISKELATESIVLLKNNNNTLPLDKNQKICVMGQMANDKRAVLGSWSLDCDINETVTIYDGIKSRAENTFYFDCSIPKDRTLEDTYDTDVVIVVIGESDKITGEANSIASIELSDEHKHLIKCAKKLNKKVIGILSFGRPRAFESVIDDFDALLYAWHGGSQIGNAIGDILFGDSCPSGKLPITFPRMTGQIPIYYNCTATGKGVDGYYNKILSHPNYWDTESSPLFPFGFGLSYTQFEYGQINVQQSVISLEEIKEGKTFDLSINIKNTGDFSAKEVVQCYIKDCLASMVRPQRELKLFEKVMIQKDKSQTVTFRIGAEQLGFYNSQGKYIIEKGDFRVYIGSDCLANNYVTISIK